MSERKDQPAALKRRIEKLEAQLAAEQERSRTSFEAYRSTLYDYAELKVKMDRIRAELNA